MQGGYSTRIVVDEKFVLSIAAKDRLDAVAPLLCAGITTWSPLRHWKVGKGQRVAVNGLGGLGHMAVSWRTRSRRRCSTSAPSAASSPTWRRSRCWT